MIVIKDKDAVYFAYATGHNSNYANLRFDASTEENMDLWHLNDGKGTIVMIDARDRIVELLRYSDIFNCEFAMEALCGIRKRIIELYRGTNCRELDGSTGATIFIARENRAFRIYGDGTVEEGEGILCGRSYEDAFLVAYEHCKEIEDSYERISAIYDMVEELTGRRSGAIAVISTKGDSYTLMTKGAQ